MKAIKILLPIDDDNVNCYWYIYKGMLCRLLLAGLALLQVCFVSSAQNSDIYLTAAFNLGPKDLFAFIDSFDIELASGTYLYQDSFQQRINSSIYRDVPQGQLSINISRPSFVGVKDFSDSITVHQGVNAIIIEMDYSGKRTLYMKDTKGNPIPVPPLWTNVLDVQTDGTYYVDKPTRPKTLSIDGYRALVSNVFISTPGSNNPALEYMEDNGWAQLYSNPEGPVKHALILLDSDVHWSWKNGAYVFWKDESD